MPTGTLSAVLAYVAQYTRQTSSAVLELLPNLSAAHNTLWPTDPVTCTQTLQSDHLTLHLRSQTGGQTGCHNDADLQGYNTLQASLSTLAGQLLHLLCIATHDST